MEHQCHKKDWVLFTSYWNLITWSQQPLFQGPNVCLKCHLAVGTCLTQQTKRYSRKAVLLFLCIHSVWFLRVYAYLLYLPDWCVSGCNCPRMFGTPWSKEGGEETPGWNSKLPFMPTPVPHDDDIEPLWECDDLKVSTNIFSSPITNGCYGICW